MLVAILIPLILLVATVLLERFETTMLDSSTTRRTAVRTPLRLDAPPARSTPQRHLQAVAEPLVVDVTPAEVIDRPLRRVS